MIRRIVIPVALVRFSKEKRKKEIVERNMPFKSKLYAALFIPENSCIEKHRYLKQSIYMRNNN